MNARRIALLLFALKMMAGPDIEGLRWHNRVLVVFALYNNSQMLREQDKIVAADAQGLVERDIKVFRIVGAGSEAQNLRAKLNIGSQPFTVVLIGKDGSVKLRRGEPLSADKLFQTIDKMPMRQEEMKHK